MSSHKNIPQSIRHPVINPKYIWFRKQLQWEVSYCSVQCGMEGEEKGALGKWHLDLETETSAMK